MKKKARPSVCLLSALAVSMIVFLTPSRADGAEETAGKPVICNAKGYTKQPNGALVAMTGRTGRLFRETKEMEFKTADGALLTLVGDEVLGAPTGEFVRVVGIKQEISLPVRGFSGDGPPPRWLKQSIRVKSIDKAQPDAPHGPGRAAAQPGQ